MTKYTESVDVALIEWVRAVLKRKRCRFTAYRSILREAKNHEDIKDKRRRRIVIELALKE